MRTKLVYRLSPQSELEHFIALWINFDHNLLLTSISSFVLGMMRQGLPPPQGLPTMPLPSNRIPAGMRPRPISSRGGQLQVAGVVVGSWGANYGYQQNMRQQTALVGGYQGRGRGMMGPGASNFSQQNLPRGRGQQRKPGPPTFQVNKRNNVRNLILFQSF